MRFYKQPGEKWLVTMAHGGQQEVGDKDDAMYDTELGLFMYHNDASQSTSYIPPVGIGFVRTWWPGGRKVESREDFRSSRDLPRVPAGEIGTGDDVVDAEVVDD